jgi:signal transduction histidine kinase
MRRYTNSLQSRLILGFAVILVLVLGSVGVYARTAVTNAVERYEDEVVSVREDRLQTMITHLLANGRRGPQLEQIIEQAGSLYGMRIAVADEAGTVIGQTQVAPEYAIFGDNFQPQGREGVFPKLGRPREDRPIRKGGLFLPLYDGDIPLGSVAITAAGLDSFVRPEPQAVAIIASLDSFLLWTGLGASAFAVAISMFVSRRTLSPLRSLQYAAERLGAGDLAQRVRVARNDEIGEMAETFNAMAEGLEQAEAQRRVLMADVAHELRTPLANIQGYVEAIRDGVVDADEATIDTIHHQVLHLAHLIEDLRLLALAEAGALPLDPQLASLADVASTSADAFRPRADAKQIALTFAGPNSMPTTNIDKERIAQVMGNLLENAIRHTPEHGTVSVTVGATASHAHVSIADTGPGIPGSELDRIFDRFHRLDPSRSRETGGAGLGLTIAKQLIEAHGGSITVNSTEGQGSTFTFELPADR